MYSGVVTCTFYYGLLWQLLLDRGQPTSMSVWIVYSNKILWQFAAFGVVCGVRRRFYGPADQREKRLSTCDFFESGTLVKHKIAFLGVFTSTLRACL